MNIGIIGDGKMGKDIFNYFFQYNHQLTLLCKRQEQVDILRTSIEKQLAKGLRRGYLSEESYREKKQSYEISADYEAIKNCDLLIESITEDKELKQGLFKDLEAIVKPQCILATNTSSIPLSAVFEKCSTTHRCLGIHFFYPVKVIEIVEINGMKATEPFYTEVVQDLLKGVNKNPLILEEEANMLLTKMFTTLITQIYRIYEEGYLTAEAIDNLLKERLLTFGLFEIIDSTGLNIIVKSIENFIEERYQKLYIPLYKKAQRLIEEGYGGGTGKIGLAYELEYPTSLKFLPDQGAYGEEIIKRLKALLINEMAYYIRLYGINPQQFNDAVQEVFGFHHSPFEMLEEIGEKELITILKESHQTLGDQVYQPEDLSFFLFHG